MGEKAPEISSLSFEEALKELEALSQRLSQGGLPLEESVEAYARGSELRKHCNDLLKRAKTEYVNWIKSSAISRMMTNLKKPR